MRSSGFICFALLWLVQSSGICEELHFTGSFWDDADSFRLTIDFKKSPARLKWDGYPDNAIDRKKGAPGRSAFEFDLTEEEISLLHSLKKGLPLCHNGHRASLGTGLSNSVRIWHEGKLKDQKSYFHIEPSAILGQRMSEIPLSFQEKSTEAGLSEAERSEWFKEISDLTSDLESWQEALEILGNAQKDNSKIPWPKLLTISQEAEASETIESFKGELASAYEAEPVIDLLLSQQNRSKYFPELGVGHVIVRIDDIAVSEIDRWYSISPPQDMGTDGDQWTLAPPTFLLLLGDYIGIEGKFGEVNHYGLFNLINPHEAQEDEFRKRLDFIESSGWATPLLKEGQNVPSNNELRIFNLTFEKKMSQCVVLTRPGDEARFTLLQVENGVWKILRQLDSADWGEYRWKEPPFK